MTSPELHIRRGTPADAAALTAIALAAKAHWGYPAAWIELWRDELAFTAESFGQWDVFCAEHDGELVGVCALSRIEDEDGAAAGPGEPSEPCEPGAEPCEPGAEIEGLWVLPAHMQRGIGAALMARAVDEARRQGMRYLRIVADPHAVGFYEKLGARPVGAVASRVAGRMLPVLRLDL